MMKRERNENNYCMSSRQCAESCAYNKISGKYYTYETIYLKKDVEGFHEENCLNQKTFSGKGSS